MPNGYVYVLINPALKGQVKIGMTTKSPEQRAVELSTTGIPHEFVVVYSERVSDCEQVERLLHERLAAMRVNPNREFFQITPQLAVRAVLEVAEPYRIDEAADAESGVPDKQQTADAESGVRQQWYSELLGLAQERGMAEGWAAYRFRERFSVWPNGLNKTPITPTAAVRSFDQHCRIKFAKSK